MKYLRRRESLRAVVFPPRIGPTVFEHILHEAFKSTGSRITKSVKFDFSSVIWCDVFELSLLALWITELVEAGKRVSFVLPTDKAVYRFLVTYRFDAFLRQLGVMREGDLGYAASAAPTNLPRAPFFPLTFFDEAGFRKLLTSLSHANRLEVLLSDIKTADIVKSGAIRDIVLKELIDNTIVHAGSRAGYIIMTKLGATSPDTAVDWTRRVTESASELEKAFFERLHGKPFLALVIGDRGDGIKNTLRESFVNDPIAKKWGGGDERLVEYAFLYHSTRRSLDERIGAIRDVISARAKTYPPPTGLYRLKELVRQYHGLLYVRTGDTIGSFDFYSNQNVSRPETASRVAGRKNAEFGGTQYKIYFPLEAPRKYFPVTLPFGRTDYSRLVDYQYIAVDRYVNAASDDTMQAEAEALFEVFNEVDRAAASQGSRPIGIILDFKDQTLLSAKAFHYLLFEMMQRQNETLSVICLNVSAQPHEWPEAFQSRSELNRSLLIFDSVFEPHFFGVSADNERRLRELLAKGVSDAASELAILNNHLFSYNDAEDRYESLHSQDELVDIAKHALRLQLSEILLDPLSELFMPDAKVLLPSLKYCKGFFELYKLMTVDPWRSLARLWYKYLLIGLDPDYVISISRHMGTLLEELVVLLKRRSLKSIQHINIATPATPVDLVKLLLKVGRKKRGIVISEVIGSGETLNSVLTNVQQADVICIAPVINASVDAEESWEFKGRAYPTEAIIRRPFEYHKELPRGWRYSEIQQIDPDTHISSRKPARLEGPLWKTIVSEQVTIPSSDPLEVYRNTFLDECVVPTNAFLEGHFVNEGRHILYLFNIPVLVGHFSNDIVSVIVQNIRDSLNVIRPSPNVTHVLYPVRNPGVRKLAELISLEFGTSTSVPVLSEGGAVIPDPLIQLGNMDAIVIIDDALVSGDTIFGMYDLADQTRDGHIFTYVLIKRGSDEKARRFERVSEYDHWKVQARYLADVEIPTYGPQDCPVCERLIELDYLRDQFPHDNVLTRFIDDEISKFTPLEVETVARQELTGLEAPLVDNWQILTTRWKLELAKKKMGARKELHNIVRNYKTSPRDALCFFKVIFRERQVFLLDDEVRPTIFYDTFASNIVEACRYFTENPEIIDDEEFEASLCLLLLLDDRYGPDDILEAFRRTLALPNKFFRVLIQIFFFRDAHEYPGRMTKIFGRVYEQIEEGHEFRAIIGEILDYWRRKEEESKHAQSARLTWFMRLAGGILHEVGHLKDTVIYNLEYHESETDKILNSWSEFHSHVFKALPLIRRFSGNHTSSKLFTQLTANSAAIELRLGEGQKIATALQHRANGEAEQQRRHLRNCVASVFRLVSSEGGTATLLENFKTNMKSVVFDVLQQQGSDLERCGITVERDFPDVACTVFGEDIFIAQILQNLIENVWRASSATRLKIQAILDFQEDRLKLFLLDDGRGLPTSFTFGQGLKVARSNARACCGDFDIRNLDESYPDFADGFRTAAIVTLPLL